MWPIKSKPGDSGMFESFKMTFYAYDVVIVRDNTFMLVLQLATILHMVPEWKSHTKLRIFTIVESKFLSIFSCVKHAACMHNASACKRYQVVYGA